MLLHGKDVHSSVQTKHIITVCTMLCTQGLAMVVIPGLVRFDFKKILNFCIKYCHLLSAGPAAHAADARFAGSV